MFEPRSIHEFARELELSSSRFVAMFAEYENGNKELYRDLAEESKRGTDLLNTLVLNIRNEMDFERLQVDGSGLPTAGVLMKTVDQNYSVVEFKSSYSGEMAGLIESESFKKMTIRQVLNKLAHFDKARSDFWVANSAHQLLLVGKMRSDSWFCVLDIKELVTLMLMLPDQAVKQ